MVDGSKSAGQRKRVEGSITPGSGASAWLSSCPLDWSTGRGSLRRLRGSLTGSGASRFCAEEGGEEVLANAASRSSSSIRRLCFSPTPSDT